MLVYPFNFADNNPHLYTIFYLYNAHPYSYL